MGTYNVLSICTFRRIKDDKFVIFKLKEVFKCVKILIEWKVIQMQKRVIPKKNYVILGIIALFTIISVLYASKRYEVLRGNQSTYTASAMFFKEIKESEIEDHIVENPNVVIYLASSKDENLKSFEEEFKGYVKKNNIVDEFTYIDTSYIVNNDVYKEIENKYFSKGLKNNNIHLSVIPNMLFFHDGEIIDILYKKEEMIEMVDVEPMLEKYEVVE